MVPNPPRTAEVAARWQRGGSADQKYSRSEARPV